MKPLNAPIGESAPKPSSNDLPYDEIFEAAAVGIVVTSAEGPERRIISVNPAFCAMTGYGVEELIGRDCRLLQGPLTDPAKVAAIADALGRFEPARQTLLNYRKDGSTFWNEISITPLRGDGGVVTGFVGFQSDASRRVEYRKAVRTLESRLKAVADNLPGFIFQRRTTADGASEFSYCSPSLNRLLEVPEGPISYETYLNYIHPEDLPAVLGAVSLSKEALTPSDLAYRLVTESGREVWLRSYSTPRRSVDGEVVWAGCAVDVTSEREAQSRLSYLNQHDPISGLLNLPAFQTRLAQIIGGTDGSPASAVLCAIEILELADIRETLGGSVADALTQALGRRLAAHVSSDDQVARLSESQFAVVSVQGPAQADAIAEKLKAEIARPFRVLGRVLSLTADLGLAVHSNPGSSAAIEATEVARELIKQVQVALNEAKRQKNNAYVIYSSEIDERVSTRVQIRHAFRHALAARQFDLHYQPLVNLTDLRIVGAEALLRWRHPTLGVQRPDVFIPLAEESGFIVPLGAWVMEEAMRQACKWDDPVFGSPKIAINVSGVQLQKSDLTASVEQALARTGVDPRQVELELTESCLIGASSRVTCTVARLNELGVGLAIDDFGTGYASYQNLKTLAVGKLKLDRSFVRNLGRDPSDVTIVRSIITMARSLGLDLVAEGVETWPQYEFLQSEGCPIGQGYLFAEPVPAMEFEDYLTGRRRIRFPPNWPRPSTE